PETVSASFWTGALLRCASATERTIRASTVASPTCSARITSVPVPLTVAPVTRSPAAFATGIGSPVSMLSSTELAPSSTLPSTGIFSPGRTRSRSPARTASSASSCSTPSGPIRTARAGCSRSNARIAAPVCRRAPSSSTCPSSTRVTMTAAGSKYTAPPSASAPKLNRYAAATPSAINVNMLSCCRSERQPRTKNGHPHHSTTGVATAACTHGQRSAIPSATTGMLSIAATHSRRVIARSSLSSSPPAWGATGSSPIPQIGHVPGPARRTCGCIGQVYSLLPAACAAAGLGASPWQQGPCSAEVLVNDIQELPAHLLRRFAPLGHGAAHAVRQVVAHQLARHPPQSLLHRRHLHDDVRAVALLLDHPLQPPHLAFDPLQPPQVRRRLVPLLIPHTPTPYHKTSCVPLHFGFCIIPTPCPASTSARCSPLPGP